MLIVFLMVEYFSIANADIRNLAPNQIIPLVQKITKRGEAGDANTQLDLAYLYGRGIGIE